VMVVMVMVLGVGVLGLLVSPIAGTFGRALLRSPGRQHPEQGQTGHQSPQHPAAGASLGDRAGQTIEGGRVHGGSSGQQA